VDIISLFQKSISKPEFGPFVLLIAEVVAFSSRSSAFLSPGNISNFLAFTPELGMIALGMTLLMISGEFDLSVGSVFGFAPIVMWTFYTHLLL
jgi:simple sugar transport system permease protein